MGRKLIAVSLLVLATIGAPVARAATNTQVPGVARFGIASDVRQVVVVKTVSWSTSYASLETWSRSRPDQPWKRTSGAHPGRVGYAGIRVGRLQNSGKTPAGSFSLDSAFGNGPSPGTKLSWRTVGPDDYWVLDPTNQPSFNRYLTRQPGAAWKTSEAEHLRDYPTQYRYAVVIGWNQPNSGRSTVKYGGGIFLHVNGRGATAGCVSVTADYANSITRWLDPAARPRIVIGTSYWLRTTS